MAIESTVAGRASAVLTTGEVNGAVLDMRDCLTGSVAVQYDFTIGSLTNVILRVYAGSATPPTTALLPNGQSVTQTLTATGTGTMTFDVAGCRYFMVSAQGTGTVTSSLLAFNYHYKDYETTTRQGGETVMGD